MTAMNRRHAFSLDSRRDCPARVWVGGMTSANSYAIECAKSMIISGGDDVIRKQGSHMEKGKVHHVAEGFTGMRSEGEK